MATNMVFLARSGLPAPMFWPAIEETEACMAREGRMATLLTLPAMLRAADPVSPATPLATVISTMKDRLTRVPWREAGIPSLTSWPARALSILKLRG